MRVWWVLLYGSTCHSIYKLSPWDIALDSLVVGATLAFMALRKTDR